MHSMATQESDLWELTTRSEAVYLDAVSEDASSGFIARLCRFPDEKLAWTWLHVFHHGHVHSYTSHDVRCTDDPVVEDDDLVDYAAGEFRFTRNGNRLAPGQVSFSASAQLHSGSASPHGEGVLPCEIRAEFTGEHAGVQSRSGRSEVLGATRAGITLGDVRLEIEARGQFHEQIQQDPRFTRPFTYATLRGRDVGCIFTRGVRGATGTLIRSNRPSGITSVKIGPPGTIRRLSIGLDSGETVSGEAIATYQYEIPIFHMIRPGTLVSAEIGDARFSGCLNDLVFSDLAFDHL